MDKFISCRANEQQVAKLREMAATCGVSAGEVLRTLIDSADVEPVRTFRPVIKNKTADRTFHGTGGGFAFSNQS